MKRRGALLLGSIVAVVMVSGCGTEKAAAPPPAAGSEGASTAEAEQPAAAEPSTPNSGTGVVRYLSLGDSLTQGIGADDLDNGTFPALLAEKWRAAGCDVELQNAGISGYTAGQVLTDQVPAIAEFMPTVITFQAGGNDIANAVPLDEYRQNVAAVLDAASDSGARVIVLAQNEWYRSPDGQNYGENQAAQRAEFDAALIAEADAHGAEFVDMRPLYEEQADGGQWVEDGLHPTPEAYEAWAAGLAEAVPAPCN